MSSLANLLEVFLILDRAKQCLPHWVTALARLSAPDIPPYVTVQAHYEAAADRAYLRLAYDLRQLGRDRLRFVSEVAELAEIKLIEPAAWPVAERTRFMNDRIAGCQVAVIDRRTISDTLTELARRARAVRALATPTVAPPPPPPSHGRPPQTAKPRETLPPDAIPRLAEDAPTARRASSGSGVASDDVPVHIVMDEIDDDVSRPIVNLELQAMRLDKPTARPSALAPLPRQLAAQPLEPPRAARQARTARTVPGHGQANAAGPFPASAARVVHEPAPDAPAQPTPKNAASAPTLATEPDQANQQASAAQPEAQAQRHERAASVAITGSFFALEDAPPLPTFISARFLRGGRWLPARVGSLSLRNGFFLSGATPRLEDQVHIALAFGEHAALVRGKVTRLATSEQEKGAAGFAVTFELDHGSQAQLVALLTTARNAKITIKQAPARVGRRFPVEWPVTFGSTRGPIRADALDVSSAGMFVAPVRALELGNNMSFSIALDDGGAPVVGRVCVMRHVNEVEARRSSFAAGYGLAIDSLASGDAQRWSTFLARVAKRSDRRILVGASPHRLAELSAGLGAAGYSVTGGSDAGAFVHLAESERRPVDAAVIDPDWAGGGPSGAWLEALLGARNVPCVSTHGDARRARAVVDRLLHV